MPNNSLKKIRESQGFSVKTVSEEMEINPQRIWNYEAGKYNIPDELVEKLTKFFEVSKEELLTPTGEYVISSKGKEIMMKSIKMLDGHIHKKKIKLEEEEFLRIADKLYSILSHYTQEGFDEQLEDELKAMEQDFIASQCFKDNLNKLKEWPQRKEQKKK